MHDDTTNPVVKNHLDYATRFKQNLKEYSQSIGLIMIGVFFISVSMCYYLVDYLFFNKNGPPIVVAILSIILCLGLAVGAIAITSLRKPK